MNENGYFSEACAEKVWNQLSLDALTYGASPPSMSENQIKKVIDDKNIHRIISRPLSRDFEESH